MQNDETPSDVVGKRVRELRTRRKWPVEKLAERCAQVGAPQLTVDALYLVEGGRRDPETKRRRRRVTVDELLALALAFDVAPVVLLLPFENVGYRVTPDVTELAEAVYLWIAAKRPIGTAPTGDSGNPFNNPTLTFMNDRQSYIPLTEEPSGDTVRLLKIESLLESIKANTSAQQEDTKGDNDE